MKAPSLPEALLLAASVLLSCLSLSPSLAATLRAPELCSDVSPYWCTTCSPALCAVPFLRPACRYTCGLCGENGQARGGLAIGNGMNVPGSRESPAPASTGRKVFLGDRRTLVGLRNAAPAPSEEKGNDTFRLREEGRSLAKKSAFLGIYAFDVVSGQAVINLRRILEGMLAKSPAAVLKTLKKYNATFAIIGKDQNITDLPPYAFLKGRFTFDGRPYWTVRGVGAPDTRFTMSSAAEENLLFLASDPYVPWEVITVHEFGHTVLSVGLADQPKVKAAERSAFQAALKREAVAIKKQGQPYGFSNWYEYWSVFTEAWFHSIQRTDINLGIITRKELKKRDKALSSIYRSSAYGDGKWTYFGDKALPHEPVYAAEEAPASQPRSQPPAHRSPIDDLRKKVGELAPESIWHP